MTAGLFLSCCICQMVFFTDSYHRTGSRSLSNTCSQQFGSFLKNSGHLCIGVDLEQVLPKERGGKVNARTQAFFSHKVSPLFLSHLHTVCKQSVQAHSEEWRLFYHKVFLQSPLLQRPWARSRDCALSCPWKPWIIRSFSNVQT